MSSHSDFNVDNLDKCLKHNLKNWAALQRPPAGGKTRLLAAVVEEKPKKISTLQCLVSMVLTENFNDLYIEHLKVKVPYAWQPRAISY